VTSQPSVPGIEIGELIGTGATSAVWQGVRTATGEAVAVKVTAPERYHVGQLLELAARETAILGLIEHDHVVRLHEVHAQPDGSVAVVLDLAAGGSLAELLAARGRLDDGEAATICVPLAGALAALHAAGVVHGDVAPGNVVFTADGMPLLADFEAARLVGESHPPVVSGTPGFVAPEVLAGGLPSAASDVFGIGAVAWAAVSGRPLLDGSGRPGPAPSRSEAIALVGPRLADALVAMLAEDPAARPAADEAAVLIYQSAAPEPVRLVPRSAADPARALTHRLRERVGEGTGGWTHSAPYAPPPGAATAVSPAVTEPAAPAPGSSAPSESAVAAPTSPSAVTASPPPSAPAPGAAATVIHSPASAPAPGVRPTRVPPARPGGLARRLSTRVRLAILAVALLVFVAVFVVLLQRQASAAAAAQATVTSTGTVTIARPTGTHELQGDPQPVLAALAAARAEALMSGDPARLAAADAPGSPMLTADTALLTQLGKAGQRYDNLTYHVRSAQWVSGDATTVRLIAVIDLGVHRVVGPGTEVRQVPAQEGRPFVYTLTRTPAGWRIAEISS